MVGTLESARAVQISPWILAEPDMREQLHGVNALLGVRALVKGNRSSRLTVSVDLLHHQFFQGVAATTASYNIGLHF